MSLSLQYSSPRLSFMLWPLERGLHFLLSSSSLRQDWSWPAHHCCWLWACWTRQVFGALLVRPSDSLVFRSLPS